MEKMCYKKIYGIPKKALEWPLFLVNFNKRFSKLP